VPNPRRPRGPDDGFTLVEVLVAISIVTVVMLSLASFFTVTIRIGAEQGDRQAAVQAADDAMERARALQVGAMLTGRDLQSSLTQWNSASTIPGLSSVLSSAATGSVCTLSGGASPCMAYDTTAASGAGPAAALPTTYRPVTLNNINFQQHWYVSFCERDSTGTCVPANRTGTSGLSHFYRVIVAVTWAGRSCTSGTCSFITATLIGKDTSDPEFSTNVSSTFAITTTPAAQAGDQGVAITSLPFAATGGTTPYAWSATSLPTGLSINAGSGAITGTPTVAGTYSTVVIAADSNTHKDFITFTWTVGAPPAVTAPGTVSSPGGVAFSKTFAMTGGTSPYTWTATGLPAGLSLASATGVVSGTPTTVASGSVTLTVTDKFSQTASKTFTWTVPALAYAGFTPPGTAKGTAISAITLAASGGIQPYTWTATGLPPGLTLSSGVISGTPTTSGSYPVTTTVTDSKGTAIGSTVTWTVP
jgi:prepilin-type N-terminal cleavage/methylation domain-containing protein